MPPVGLCEWKILTVHQIITIMFKDVLRTFETEILKIFKTFSLTTKIRRSYKWKRVPYRKHGS